MGYEFNNWKAFYKAVEFVKRRHLKSFPIIRIEVPQRLRDSGWEDFYGLVDYLKQYEPENLEDMTIYGRIDFEVNNDENRGIRL